MELATEIGPIWRALMSKAVRLLNQVRKDEEGAALIEYTILLGIIAIAVIGFATTISGWITTQWSTLCAKLTGGAC
jgi:pilus assembly protein Flp/PilA